MFKFLRHPKQAVKEKVMAVVIAKLLRHGLTLAGGAGLVSDNEVSQLAGAAATILGISWSLIQAYLEAQRKESSK